MKTQRRASLIMLAIALLLSRHRLKPGAFLGAESRKQNYRHLQSRYIGLEPSTDLQQRLEVKILLSGLGFHDHVKFFSHL